MSIDKIKQFVADHKKELITTTVVVGGAVLVILGYRRRTKNSVANAGRLLEVRDIPIPDDLKVWNTAELWADKKYLNAIIGNIPFDDLGELGKVFIKNGLAQPGDIANVMIGVKLLNQ